MRQIGAKITQKVFHKVRQLQLIGKYGVTLLENCAFLSHFLLCFITSKVNLTISHKIGGFLSKAIRNPVMSASVPRQLQEFNRSLY
jgi:hypothetical protein